MESRIYSDERAAFFAELCLLSYRGSRSEQEWSRYVTENFHWLGVESVGIMDEHGTQAAVVQFPEYQVIVFRGSDEGLDWIDNLAFYPTESCGLFPGKTHTGFRNHTRRVYRQLLAAVDREKPLYLTGHSLGGAAAIMMAAIVEGERDHYVHNLPEVSGVYAYCAPRIGDGRFVRWLNWKLGDRVFVFWNNNDVVPHLPSAMPSVIRKLAGWLGLKSLEHLALMPLGYRSPEHVIYIDEQGVVTHYPPIWVLLKGLWNGLLQKVQSRDERLFGDHDISAVATLLRAWSDRHLQEKADGS